MEKTTNQILAVAEDMFLKYGIKSVTMDDISRKLGVSKKTLYSHFSTKEQLVNAVMNTHIQKETTDINAIRASGKNPLEEFLKIAEYILKFLRKIKPTTIYDLQKYYRSCWQNMDNFHRKYIYKIILDNLERGIEAGIYRADINADIVARLYVGGSLRITDEELFPLADYKREELYAQFIKHHMHGIVSPLGMKTLRKHQKKIQQL